MSFIKSLLWLPSLIGILVFLPSLWYGSAWGDDHPVFSPAAKDFNLMIGLFFKNPPGGHFMPFHYFQSYIINLIFGKYAFPFGFHVYEIFLHSISCLLTTIIIYKI